MQNYEDYQDNKNKEINSEEDIFNCDLPLYRQEALKVSKKNVVGSFILVNRSHLITDKMASTHYLITIMFITEEYIFIIRKY